MLGPVGPQKFQTQKQKCWTFVFKALVLSSKGFAAGS